MIQIKDVHKSYAMGSVTVKALRGINLSIQRGEYMAILGPSGSGKSTLMHILGCLDNPTKGTYYLDGEEVGGLCRNKLAEIRNQKIGFIFQNFNLLTHASALENVELPMIYGQQSGRERRKRAMDLLDRVGLSHRMDHLPTELSGGQRQRVAVARALACDPDLILADEPTGNLDSESGKEVVSLFHELIRDGKSVIVVTHDLELAKNTKRIVRLCDGVIEEDTGNVSNHPSLQKMRPAQSQPMMIPASA